MSDRSPLNPDLIRVAYGHARQLGLPHEDAQDCAMDFRLHLLRRSNTHVDSLAWLHRCAHNFACNYLRAQIRRRQRERRHIESAPPRGQRLTESAVHGPGPKTLTLRKALWDQVFETLHKLTPDQRDLFLNYHVRQQSWEELAQRTGRNTHALQQALSNIHRRLAHLLLAQGWSAQDAKQLYNAFNSAAPLLVRP